MAVSRYVITATTTVAAGTVTTVVAGEPGTGGAAGFGNASVSAGAEDWPVTFIKNTAIVLDPAGALFSAIGAGNLRAWVDGQDTVGHAAISNLAPGQDEHPALWGVRVTGGSRLTPPEGHQGLGAIRRLRGGLTKTSEYEHARQWIEVI